MEEIKFWKSYCIDWKTAEEKINMEQVREERKKKWLGRLYWRGKNKMKTSDAPMVDFPSERKN